MIDPQTYYLNNYMTVLDDSDINEQQAHTKTKERLATITPDELMATILELSDPHDQKYFDAIALRIKETAERPDRLNKAALGDALMQYLRHIIFNQEHNV